MAVSSAIRINDSSSNISNIFATPDFQPVPHHLLDTKIFAALGSNDVIEVRPSVVNFHGFEVGKIYRKKLRILNVASNCQRLHIIPPETNHFNITYTKNESLVPGMYVDVVVEFKSTGESHHYNDCIRVHCESTSNLVIPIHAYMILNVADSLPSSISFKPALIGHRSTKEYLIKNTTLSSFDFQVNFVERHEAFKIEPMNGIIEASSELLLKVSFKPLEYVTACAEFQIFVSHFNSEPFYCKLTGSSQPGLALEAKKKELENDDANNKLTDPRVMSPLWRSRSKKLNNAIKQPQPPVKAKEVVKDGIRFPVNLSNPAAVTYVLTQQPGKLKAKDIREAVKTNDKSQFFSDKQMKEAMFEHMVRENIEKEEKNQLRWCVRLGEDKTTEEEREKIIKERDKQFNEYSLLLGEIAQSQDFERIKTMSTYTRITRLAGELFTKQPQFDIYENDEWDKRYALMKKFVQASRKLIIRLRVSKHLEELKKHLPLWKKGDFTSATPRVSNSLNIEQQIVENVKADIQTPTFEPLHFHQRFHTTDEMEWKKVGKVDVSPVEMNLEPHFKTYDLKVPQQYKVLSYNKHPMTYSVKNYIPKNYGRSLRTKNNDGQSPAEGQNVKITKAESDNVANEMNDVSINKHSAPSRRKDDTATDHVTDFSLPKRLLEPPTFHPMHIFNPLPGVVTHAEKLPYSEVDDDYRFCPVPRHGMPGQLDHENVIADTMSWKEFPSNALVIASNWPTLSDVYVPKNESSFGDDLLMNEVPSFLDNLPSDGSDAANDDDGDDDHDEEQSRDYSSITPNEMLAKHFGEETTNFLSLVKNQTSDWKPYMDVSLLPTTNNPNYEHGLLSRETMLNYLDSHVKHTIRENNKSLEEKINSQVNSFDN